MHVLDEVNENKPKQHEVTDNQPNEAKQGEVTEQDNELKGNKNENAANANSDNKRTEEKCEPMHDEEMEIIQDTDSKLHVQNKVKQQEVVEKDESMDN